jgi:hypothetical protein
MVKESVMILLANLKIKRPDATCFAALFTFKALGALPNATAI